MRITRKTNGDARRYASLSTTRFWSRALLCGAGAFLFASGLAQAQTTIPTAPSSASQLTISKTTEKDVLEDNLTSVVFTGPYVLTLKDGQTIRPVFISRETGAVLRLGDGTEETTGNVWTMTGNSPSWDGTTNVLSGNTLALAAGVANPAGAWSETNAGSYATVSLYDGATLKLPPRAVGSDGQPQAGETKIGKLTTSSRTDATIYDPAVVEVGANQNLIVENGLDVDANVGVVKRGTGKEDLRRNDRRIFDSDRLRLLQSR